MILPMAFKCTLSNDMGEGWKGVTCKNNRRLKLVTNQDFFNYELGDMNSNTRVAVYLHLKHP
jgi:hypothetical protein